MAAVLYPYGSTARMRADVLCALGVLKVATASQLQRLARPDARDNKVARNALLDLAHHGLVVSDGNTQGPPGQFGRAPTVAAAGPGRHPKSQKIWRLTPAGLDAAAQLLDPDRRLGGTARGAGRHGAPHAMATNETLIAFIQPRPEQPAADAALPPAGIGTIASWATEVVLPVTGSVSAPSKGSPRPDAVLRAPESEPAMPFLAVEVDGGTETPARIAEKFERYRRFFRRTVSAPAGPARERRVPYWRTLYGPTDREGHPPVALVFTGAGPRGLANRIRAVGELTEAYWSGRTAYTTNYSRGGMDTWTDFSDAIPILATTLNALRAHGPYGPIWRRYGHSADQEDLAAALANPDGAQARKQRLDDQRIREEEEREREREQHLRERQERERQRERAQQIAMARAARRGTCQRCGQPRADDQPVTDSELRRVPAPDGLHCVACRRELATRPDRGLLGRFRRGS
ncbi:replication-relaxation family protein [Streptomyces mayteni]